MPNMSSVIKQHDQKVLSSSQTDEKRQCNCRNPASCSIDGKCLTKNIAYKAVLSPITDSHTYYRSSEDFKCHYSNHTKAFCNQHYTNYTKAFCNQHYTNYTKAFCNQHYKNYTKFSRHIWDLKNAGIHYNITWRIAAYASAYRCGTIRCDLCITKKDIKARASQNNLFSKRTEIISKCQHKNKFTLQKIKKN